jgi:hypothetical protein
MSRYAESRKRLFKQGRPNIRLLDIVEDGVIGKDMSIIWAAYTKGSFGMSELTQEDFTEKFLEHLKQFYAVWMVDDTNYHYSDGEGAVGMIFSKFNGWSMEPEFHPFPWATDKNKLKMAVSFMMMARYEKGIGTLNFSTTDETFYQHLRHKYGVVYYVGKVPRGTMGKDSYLFYGRGKDFFRNRTATQ